MVPIREIDNFKSSAHGRRLDSNDKAIGVRAKLVDDYLLVIVVRDEKFYYYALDNFGSVVTMVAHESDRDALRECMKQIEAREKGTE